MSMFKQQLKAKGQSFLNEAKIFCTGALKINKPITYQSCAGFNLHWLSLCVYAMISILDGAMYNHQMNALAQGGGGYQESVYVMDIKSLQNRLKVCYVLSTSAGLPRLLFFAVAIKSTNEANKAGSMCR